MLTHVLKSEVRHLGEPDDDPPMKWRARDECMDQPAEAGV